MTEETIDRTPRASKTRANKAARKPWSPPSLLDAPPAPEGFTHRWIRAEVRGFDDRKNISARLREGWELVRKDEYPDFEAPILEGGRHEGVFGVGGLLLARIPNEIVEERKEYFEQRTSIIRWRFRNLSVSRVFHLEALKIRAYCFKNLLL